MDIFVEQIVKKKTSGKDTALKILIVLGVALLAAIGVFVMLFIPMFSSIALILVFGVFFGGYYLLTSLDCEYEYIVTNGEIDIDKIIAKRKRVRLITARASTFEAFGRYDEASDASSDVTIVSAAGTSVDGSDDNPAYYADFKHASAGSVRLIFTPEEKVVEAIKPFLPRQLKVNLKK